MPRDLYDVLGVAHTASEAEIRHAFHILAKRYHPDVNPGRPDAAHRFVEVGDAAETLLDPSRRARYDQSLTPRSAAPARAPSPADGPKPPSAAPAAHAHRTSPADVPEQARQASDDSDAKAAKILAAFLAVLVGSVLLIHFNPGATASQKGDATATNGSVVWRTAGFSLSDGFGINLAGSGARIQIFPGMSADVEFIDGSLASAGTIALLPHGETLTFQHCESAVAQAASQSGSGEITPAIGSSVCVAGSGGDLASIEVVSADGSSITVDMTVWENV